VNDDFLNRLRAQPSRQFKARLKQRLDRLAQESGPARARRSYAVLAAALLIGGGALAVAALTMRGVLRVPWSSAPWATTRPAESRGEGIAEGSHEGRDAPPHVGRQLRRMPWLEGDASDSTSSAPAVVAASAPQTEPPAISTSVSPGVAASNPFASPPISILVATQLYPATRDFAEQFSRDGRYPTANVQSALSSSAIAQFCGPPPRNAAPQIIAASRRIRQTEAQGCVRAGIVAVSEYQVASQVVLIARSATAGPMALSARDLYLALAKEVPAPPPAQSLIPNPYRTWNQIDPALGAGEIAVFGSADAGALSDTIMARGCRTFAWIAALEETDAARFRGACRRLRDDGSYHGEVDPFTVEQAVLQEPTRLGVFDQRFVTEHWQELATSPIDGIEPSAAAVAALTYPGALGLYLYVDRGAGPPYLTDFVNAYLGALWRSGTAYLQPVPTRVQYLNLLKPSDLPP
jgi:phosphate transport system substrate-binding protein